MRITTTDGQDYYMPDYCQYCELDTGGNHQINCPCYQPPFERLAVQNPIVNMNIEWQLQEIRARSHKRLGEAWKKLANL